MIPARCYPIGAVLCSKPFRGRSHHVEIVTPTVDLTAAERRLGHWRYSYGGTIYRTLGDVVVVIFGPLNEPFRTYRLEEYFQVQEETACAESQE